MPESKVYNEKDRRPPIITSQNPSPRGRIRFGVITALLGLILFIFGAAPEVFGLDRSPVVGFVQIAVFLVGMALISLGGYVALRAGWQGFELTLTADIGARLISTGYVVCVASGMADVFGFGSEAGSIPKFGLWQQRGVLLGQVLIGLGFFLLYRWRRNKDEPETESEISAPEA